jgi:hypothetical protein
MGWHYCYGFTLPFGDTNECKTYAFLTSTSYLRFHSAAFPLRCQVDCVVKFLALMSQHGIDVLHLHLEVLNVLLMRTSLYSACKLMSRAGPASQNISLPTRTLSLMMSGATLLFSITHSELTLIYCY